MGTTRVTKIAEMYVMVNPSSYSKLVSDIFLDGMVVEDFTCFIWVYSRMPIHQLPDYSNA